MSKPLFDRGTLVRVAGGLIGEVVAFRRDMGCHDYQVRLVSRRLVWVAFCDLERVHPLVALALQVKR